MTAFEYGRIRDAAHLKVCPDGTIISWLRIPGDRTSEAVAFVRRELDPAEGVTTWVSPGGWEPQTIESAGVTFPCQVVRFGEFNPDHYLGAELPVLSETLGEINGGTWAREKALECATRLYAGALAGGSGIQIAEVIKDAGRFEDWLDRDDEQAPLSERLLDACDAINEARALVGPTAAVGLSVEALRTFAIRHADDLNVGRGGGDMAGRAMEGE